MINDDQVKKMNKLSVLKKEEWDDLPISSLTLKIGDWKMLFTEQEYKVLIAETLNVCLHEHEFKHSIVGYLITKRRVCLVLKMHYRHIPKMLDFFYDSVKRKVIDRFERMKKTFLKRTMQHGSMEMNDLFDDLFEQFPLENDSLVRLITGREVELPYYNPHLARLKDRIRNYNFCSAIDYSGAKSPVLVTLLKDGMIF